VRKCTSLFLPTTENEKSEKLSVGDSSGIIVEKLVEYMSFKTYYENANTKDEVPVNEFLERIPPEIVLEL